MFENLRFVFFDVGSTLLFANRERMLEPLYARGIRPSEAELRAMECRVKNEFDDAMGHGHTPDHGFWEMFYQRLFGELHLRDEDLRRQLIANTRASMNWNQMRPGTREALERIGAKYRLAVISNACGTASIPSRTWVIVGARRTRPEAASRTVCSRCARVLISGNR